MKVINIMVLVSAVILAGGGGGGGGGTASTPAPVPFRADDNLADVLKRDNTVYRQGVTAFNRRIAGSSTTTSITVPNPPLDVRAAWIDGWTGSGTNILIMDDFLAFGLDKDGSPINRTVSQDDPRGVHGYGVLMSAKQTAPRATFYGLDAEILVGDHENFPGLTTYRQGGLRLADTNAEITRTDLKIHVVNMSFGSEPIIDFDNMTFAELEQEFDAEGATGDPRFTDVAGVTRTQSGALTKLSDALQDAVITKAAGNDKADSAFIIDNVRLVSTRTPNTRNRVLIVGALDKFARASTTDEHSSVGSGVGMAGYSNVAGQFTQMQERFLVEYGGSPYAGAVYLCDKFPSTSCNHQQNVLNNRSGTSYAAPRVAGFAALVRGKFPVLDGAQTAKILLDTATTEGLVCHTGSAQKSSGCAKNIYGQGRVDITTALSPIGNLE